MTEGTHTVLKTRKRLAAVPVAALAVLGLVTGCTSSGNTGGGGNPTGSSGAANSGKSTGTFGPGKAKDQATWALPPNTTPNWIWPFASLANFSVVNAGNFEEFMYRPLYWFGTNTGKPLLNLSLSLANAPKYTNGGKTITIKMKPYKWSNGEKVTAQDVLFWIHMEMAEKANYADYTPGTFPDNVTSATAPNSSTVVIKTDKKYSSGWYTYNELAQITPMPMAWDKTASGKGTCTKSVSGCKAVYSYLNGQSKKLSTYASNPLWQVVDGPWKLKSFNSDGHVSFVPNPSYSGPVKPQLKQFNEVPFTQDTAEYAVLKAGSTLDVGYVPSQSLTSPKPSSGGPVAAGPNPVGNQYNLVPWFLYGVNYFPLNFTNPKVAPMFKQLYIRQALQSTVDQNGIIKAAAKGYGVPTTGPVPTYPDSPLVSPLEKNNPYPFSISHAKSLLQSHGWQVNPNGVTTCQKPGTGSGQCGAGIAKGAGLQFNLQYASGTKTIDIAMADMKSNASQVGIKLNITQAPFNTVIGNATPTNHTWDMENWGGGWVYDPDYYPTGEALWQTGAGSNSGGYSDPTIDKLIKATTTQSGTAVLHKYEDALAKALPVIWQPNYTYSLTEVANGLSGVTPQNPFGAINPEMWHW